MRVKKKHKLWGGNWTEKSLKRSVFLYVLLPLGILFAGTAWWTLKQFEQQVGAQMRRDLELVASALERPLSHAMLREREGGIAEALRSAFELNEVYGAYLYDAEGHPISEGRQFPEPLQQEQVTRHAAEGRSHGAFGETGGRNVYSHFVPLTDPGGQLTGLLQLTRRRSEFSKTIQSIRFRAGLLFSSLFLGLSLTVITGHHRAVGRHIQSLCHSMQDVASGNHAHRHAPSGSREFQILGTQLNQMLDTLERARSEIANRRAAEQSLEARLRHSEKLAAIGALAAGVAHELGTPLCSIDARMQRELRRDTLSPGRKKLYAAIRADTARMENIIRQLLDFSRKNPSNLQTVSAQDILKQSLASLSHELNETRTTLRTEIPPGSLPVRADPLRIEQALVNLIRNAAQADPSGTVRIQIRARDREIQFTILDEGPGIPPEIASKIFEPFFTTKAVGQGTGLGLAVVHGIATDHGGRIEYAPNTPGTGSRFTLSLPSPTRNPAA